MEKLLRDRRLYELLEKVDKDLASKAREEGCCYCDGVLHRGDYSRKPRGGPAWERRESFCCSREGCRKRKTPPSVRFLGRKVYAGVVVVLLCAMMHGLSKQRVQRLRGVLEIDRQTLKRWREWWKHAFVQGDFWKAERARFMRPIGEERMPLGLVEAFGARQREGVVKLMRFLAPITTGCWKGVVAM